jgi:hypothetical protein
MYYLCTSKLTLIMENYETAQSVLAFVLLILCFMQTSHIQQCSKVLMALFLVVNSHIKWNCCPCHTLDSFLLLGVESQVEWDLW